MKKNRLWMAAGGVVVLALLVWAFSPSALEVETAVVSQGRFERSVQEDGKTRLRDRFVVSTPLSGRVARIALKQGDVVEQGAVLATLWPASPALIDARTQQEQRERMGAMESALLRAGANIERAKAALDQAVADLKRNETLAKQGFVSPTQNESGRLTVRLREKELESAVQDEHATRHELEQSRIAMRQFAPGTEGRQQRAWEVKAPIAGTVLKVNQQSEGVVLAGTPLVELGDPSRMEVVVDVLTEDAAQIKPGTVATLSGWGGADALQARVRLVEPAAFTKVSALGVEEQRVNAVLDITSAPDTWRALGDGFKVDVRVLVQVVDNALKVPVSALFPVGARSAMFVVEEGRAQQREVEVLARNGVEAWIKSDLKPGATVIVYPPSKLASGDRVTSTAH
ncbi:MAG TPA: HlyD family efflux transporter periplasmic adaptor subunit [Rhodoferax sp.]|jgi:HlyD family secretion protein|nr:HlyD family efflux transporter periplasmic adaptor subunit [Rhodoferax sp.]HQC85165.1 HlyD family efflux transporter periplasmic adaptor subunit [Rhodoferax sp.]